MKIIRSFKTELDLNNTQKTACLRHAGAARYAYNWGLAKKIEARQAGRKTPSAIDLHRELNALKKTELAWMYEVSKCAPQEALRNLDQAFANFFQRLKAKKQGSKIKLGFPRFKRKKHGIGSFRLTGAIHVLEKAIQLPRLGRLRLKEQGYLPIEGVHILSATVSEKGGHWFISLQVELDMPEPPATEKPVVGIDLGINRLAQLSDGTYFDNPRALKTSARKLKRQQRTASRRKNGGANYKKAIQRLWITHAHIANIRKDTLHKVSTMLTKTMSVIMMEDLNVNGMLKNHHIAQAMTDVGFYEFRRQVTYKGAWYGCQILLANQFYPSTKRCSQCGQLKVSIGLNEHKYQCEYCGLVIDRDLNAAINLKQLIDLPTASSAGSYACGERVRPEMPAMLNETGTKHYPLRRKQSI